MPAPVSVTENATSPPAARRGHGDRAARRRGARGVRDQVDDHALDLVAIDEDRRQIRRRVHLEAKPFRLDLQPQRFGRLAHEHRRPQRVRGRAPPPPDSIFDRSSSWRISRSSRSASSRHTCRISCWRSSSGAGDTLEQQVNAHLDAGERRPQLVRRGRDELGLEPADLAEVGDVLEQRDGADQSIVGILHRRRAHAERAPRPSTAHGSTAAALSDATACPDRSTSVTAWAMRGSRGDLVDRLADGVGPRAEQPFGGRVDARHAPVAVGHDDRVVERIDGRFGRLLRDEQLAEVRPSQLADPLRPSG